MKSIKISITIKETDVGFHDLWAVLCTFRREYRAFYVKSFLSMGKDVERAMNWDAYKLSSPDNGSIRIDLRVSVGDIALGDFYNALAGLTTREANIAVKRSLFEHLNNRTKLVHIVEASKEVVGSTGSKEFTNNVHDNFKDSNENKKKMKQGLQTLI